MSQPTSIQLLSPKCYLCTVFRGRNVNLRWLEVVFNIKAHLCIVYWPQWTPIRVLYRWARRTISPRTVWRVVRHQWDFLPSMIHCNRDRSVRLWCLMRCYRRNYETCVILELFEWILQQRFTVEKKRVKKIREPCVTSYINYYTYLCFYVNSLRSIKFPYYFIPYIRFYE